MATAKPASVSGPGGAVLLSPGTIWGGSKVLVTPDNGAGAVVFLDSTNLYEQDPGAFLQSEFLDALAEGARRAEPMIELAKWEMELLKALFAPGLVSGAVFAASVGLFFVRNEVLLERAQVQCKPVLAFIRGVHARYPTLYELMKSKVYAGVTVQNLLRGVSAEDIIFLVGRLLRGYFFDGHYVPKIKILKGAGIQLSFDMLPKPKPSWPLRLWKNWIVHNAAVFGNGPPSDSLFSMVISTTGLVMFLHSFAIMPRAAGLAANAGIEAGRRVADVELKQFEANPERYMMDAFKKAEILMSTAQFHALRREVMAASDTPTFMYKGLGDLVVFGLTMRELYANWIKMTA